MRERIGTEWAARGPRAPSAETEEAVVAAIRHARDYLGGLDDDRVASASDLASLRRRMRKPLAQDGLPPAQVVDELAADAADGLLRSSGGRFFGWVIGGTLPAALAADWLTATWDQNAAHHASGPAAAVAEEVVGEWLKDVLALPPQSSFALVTGCQMAHVTCLAAARTFLLRRAGWDVVEQGLVGAPVIRIIAGEQRHVSIDRAANLLGIGRANVELLPTDTLGRIEPAALRHRLESAPPAASILALQAGDIATGAFDRFEELIPIAREAGAWVHIDGAFGLWARASADYRPLRESGFLGDGRPQDPEHAIRLRLCLRRASRGSQGGALPARLLSDPCDGRPRPDRLESGLLAPRTWFPDLCGASFARAARNSRSV
jgi:glutamate/tyrosine decarboxylase-like PLP-dependent enzyme